MIPTQRLRRTVAALVLPAALVLTAACGSEDEDNGGGSASSESSSDSASSGPAATVSGDAGKKPEITIGENAGVGEETFTRVLQEGEGNAVAEGDFLRLDVLAQFVESDAELLNTWAPPQGESEEPPQGENGEDLRKQIVSQAGVESYLPKTVTQHLVGEPVGSRVQIEGRATEIFGESVAQQYQLAENEGVVWVVDVVSALDVDAKGEAEGEQAPVEDGMPEVEAGGKKAATITVPEGQDPPEELREQVLIEGDGAEVEAGQALAVQYTGVLWDGGEKFDSSWDRDSASAFQIGTGSVVAGWDEGLVGKHVGDRVLLVIPPDMGYGEEGNESIPGGSTLVFVVDILGAA